MEKKVSQQYYYTNSWLLTVWTSSYILFSCIEVNASKPINSCEDALNTITKDDCAGSDDEGLSFGEGNIDVAVGNLLDLDIHQKQSTDSFQAGTKFLIDERDDWVEDPGQVKNVELSDTRQDSEKDVNDILQMFNPKMNCKWWNNKLLRNLPDSPNEASQHI